MFSRAVLQAICCFFLATSWGHATPPPGWWMMETKQYAAGMDRTLVLEGRPSAFIESIVANPNEFIALNQTVSAENYRGRRVRLSGSLRSQGVAKWAGFWMRADNAQGVMVAFDNMQNRAISGTQDWQMGQVVLDIPADAHAIYFGLILDGPGKVWMNGLALEPVDLDVPATDQPREALRKVPVNLDFTE